MHIQRDGKQEVTYFAGEGEGLEGLDGEVDLFVQVAIELADGVGVSGVAAVGGGYGEVGVAVLVFELVVAGGVGEAGDDEVGGGIVEFDDGAAEGFGAVGDGAVYVAEGVGLTHRNLRRQSQWREAEERGECEAGDAIHGHEGPSCDVGKGCSPARTR